MTPNQLNRRSFLATTGLMASTVGLGLTPRLLAADAPATPRIRKALIINEPNEENLKPLKDAGFDGVECSVLQPEQAAKARAAADKLGLTIHSVLRGWAEFNSPDQAKADQSWAVTKDALECAKTVGANAVLLVPCRIGGLKQPAPWEFSIKFNPKTNHLTKVTVGDNAPYQDYIKAHNHAVDTSREAIRRLIPVAEACQVVIAVENVWNNLWVKPALFQNFVASFQSPWVKAYYDIGNHVKYARSEEWILTLGPLLAKLHAKDFKLNPADPNGEGSFVNIRDGNVRWPVVRSALNKVQYNGWITIEGGDCSIEEHGKRLDLILAGK